MRRHLQKEIDTLKKKILTMSSIIEDMVYLVTKSILERDSRMAQLIIERDEEVDNMEVEIEEECLKVLALHQPVAIDLRFIISALKINNDLERIGDLAVNIAERAVFIARQSDCECREFDFTDMARKAEGMLSRSIDAFVNMDMKGAKRVRAEDNEIDEMNRDFFVMVKELTLEHPERIATLLHFLSVSRHLERIADHATNIAEDVIYLVGAEIVRHKPEVFEE